MSFNLDQFLPIKELSLSELDEYSVSLDLHLTESKRNYAYAIANLKRMEVQIKQAVNSQDLIGLQQKYALFASSANAIKKQISLIEDNLLKVRAKKASIQRYTKKVADQKELNKTLGRIDSSLLINAIEYPVIQEVRSQIHSLSPELRQKLNLIEVVAYALNRLPSMFAHTKDGYRYHYNNAVGEFYPKIVDAVRRGIMVLLVGDPLHDSSPIPEQVFCDPPGLLNSLCELFDRKQMRWKEVPSVLRSLMPDTSTDDLLEEILTEPKNSSLSRKGKVGDITSYLKRSKMRLAAAYNNSDDDLSINLSGWKTEAKESEQAEMQRQISRIYTLKGKLKYMNVAEKFIMIATLHLMAGLTSDEVDLVEVAAHALNHFPQMYVTSERGLTLLRQKAHAKLPEYIEQVRKSFARVKYSSRSLSSEPLYSADFNLEYKEAMTALRKMLDREDLTPDNLIDVIKKFIA
jgi:hypothetical protein